MIKTKCVFIEKKDGTDAKNELMLFLPFSGLDDGGLSAPVPLTSKLSNILFTLSRISCNSFFILQKTKWRYSSICNQPQWLSSFSILASGTLFIWKILTFIYLLSYFWNIHIIPILPPK